MTRLPVFLILVISFVSLGEAANTYSSDRQRAREFVVMGYQGILDNLKTGEGPYLHTLFELLKTPADKKSDTLQNISELSKKTTNIMDFADQVVGGGVTNISVAAPPASSPAPPIPVPVVIPETAYQGDKLENALNHLTRGMKVTVYLKSGEAVSGRSAGYDARRLAILTPASRSFTLDQILAIDSPSL